MSFPPPGPHEGHILKPLRRNLSFTLMWTSTAASGFGDRMIMLAALALVGGLAVGADSTSANAAINFWFFLPYVFFALLGGWIADRLPRKWVLLGCDEARGALLLWSFFSLAGAGGIAALDVADHWRVYAMLFGIGTFAAVFNPARNAIVPQIVHRTQLQPANALVTVIGVVFSMVGMIVGSWLISPSDAGSVRTGLLLGATFYLISGTFFAFMKPRPAHAGFVGGVPPEDRTAVSLPGALVYALRHRRVIKLIGLDVLVWAAAALMLSAAIGVCKAHYRLTGDALLEEFALVGALLGFGMLAGAALTAVIRTRHESGTVVGVALVAAGLNVVLVAVVPVKTVTYFGSFCIGVFGNVAIVTIMSLLQSITPNHVRGAILGLNAMASTVLSVAIYLAIWRVPNADTWIVPVLLTLGPLLVGVGLLTLVRYLRSGPMPSVGANVLRHLVRLFVLVVHRAEFRGRQHLPADGPVILACNHTTALDPFVIQAACPRLVRWLMLTSYRFRVLQPLWRACDPICLDIQPGDDKHSGGTKQVRQIVQRLKQGEVVGMFPEGRLQYDDRVLKAFEPGVATCARLARAAIVPCWIEGTPRSRKMLVHFLRPTHTTLHFGAPFTPAKGDKPADITAELRRRMLLLASEPAEETEVRENGNPAEWVK